MRFYTSDLYQYINTISPIKQSTFEIFLQLFKEQIIKKGTYFARQGRVEKQFGIITKGVIRTFFSTEDGEEHIKSFGIPYSFIGGFSSLISETPNQINVQAISSCTILKANYRDLTELFEPFPELERLARRVTENLFIFKEKREIDLLSLTAEKRYLKFRTEYEGLEFLIPQYYIASYLGITPTQLSRIRRNLTIN